MPTSLRTALYARALHAAVESDALSGALAIRASVYSHQAANVKELLTAPELRHLVVDPPGSGKTLQALMVLNALKRAHPSLRTLIITPNRNISLQWLSELTWALRAPPEPSTHPPIYDEEWRPADARARVELNNPHDLATLRLHTEVTSVETLAPFDLIIIDEVQSVSMECLERVYRAYPERLLMLTATPPHLTQDEQGLNRLYLLTKLLEPGAARHAEAPLTHLQGQARHEAAQQIRDAWLNARFAGNAPENTRVIQTEPVRARREIDLIQYHPARSERLAEQLALEVDQRPELQDRRTTIFENALRTPGSLKRYLTSIYLDPYPQGISDLPNEYTRLSLDDLARARALCDTLAQIGVAGDNPTPVLIATDDAASTDMIEHWLRRELDVRPDKIRLIRDQLQAQPVANTVVNEQAVIAQAVQRYQDGYRPVVILQGNGEGLNLQNTRHVIFFSVPTTRRRYNQVIGRLDRPGNVALQGGRPLIVHLLVARDSRAERLARFLTGELPDAGELHELLAREQDDVVLSLARRLEPLALTPIQQVPWSHVRESDPPPTIQAISGRYGVGLMKMISDDGDAYYKSRGVTASDPFDQIDDPGVRCSFNRFAPQNGPRGPQYYGDVHLRHREFWLPSLSSDAPPPSLFAARQQLSNAGDRLHGARFSAGIHTFEGLLRHARLQPIIGGRYSWNAPPFIRRLYPELYPALQEVQLLGLIERYDLLDDLQEELRQAQLECPVAVKLALPPRVIFGAQLIGCFQPPQISADQLFLSAVAQPLNHLSDELWGEQHNELEAHLHSRAQMSVRRLWEEGLARLQQDLGELEGLINTSQAAHHQVSISRYNQTRNIYQRAIARVTAALENLEPQERVQLGISFT